MLSTDPDLKKIGLRGLSVTKAVLVYYQTERPAISSERAEL